MSRGDVEEIIEIVKKELQDVDKNAFITPVGGYRYISYQIVID